MKRRPLIAYSIAVGEKDPKYDVYTDAYGLEMNFDDEWQIDAVICAPPKLVPVIASSTSVTSMGVSIGTNAPPQFPYPASNATWIVADADALDGFNIMTTRLKVILHASDDTRLFDFLRHTLPESSALGAVALHSADSSALQVRTAAARAALDGFGLQHTRVIAYVSSPEVDIYSLLTVDGVDGFYHSSTRYDQMLKFMSALAIR